MSGNNAFPVINYQYVHTYSIRIRSPKLLGLSKNCRYGVILHYVCVFSNFSIRYFSYSSYVNRFLKKILFRSIFFFFCIFHTLDVFFSARKFYQRSNLNNMNNSAFLWKNSHIRRFEIKIHVTLITKKTISTIGERCINYNSVFTFFAYYLC